LTSWRAGHRRWYLGPGSVSSPQIVRRVIIWDTSLQDHSWILYFVEIMDGNISAITSHCCGCKNCQDQHNSKSIETRFHCYLCFYWSDVVTPTAFVFHLYKEWRAFLQNKALVSVEGFSRKHIFEHLKYSVSSCYN